MSVRPVDPHPVELVCDGMRPGNPGRPCGEVFETGDGDFWFSTVEYARRLAKDDGWGHDPVAGKDWCEGCATAPHTCIPTPAKPLPNETQTCSRCGQDIEVSNGSRA